MGRGPQLYLAIVCMAAALYLIKVAYPQEPTFTSRFLDFIKKHELPDETSISAGKSCKKV